jgi:hypothetical protein
MVWNFCSMKGRELHSLGYPPTEARLDRVLDGVEVGGIFREISINPGQLLINGGRTA